MDVTAATNSLRNRIIPASIAITVNPSASQPGAFTESYPDVCQGDPGFIYTVPNVSGTTYAWSYSGTGAAINGTGNSVTVDFGSGATSGTLSVTATDINGCGTSAATTIGITVDTPPAQPGAFNPGPATVCKGQNGVIYTVPNVAGITYIWSYFPGTGATLTETGNSVSVDFDNTATSGTLRVTASNNCNSDDRTIAITINAPPAITTQPVDQTITYGSAANFSIAATGSGLTYQWQENAGSTWNDINTGGIYTVTGSAGNSGLSLSQATVSMSGYQYTVA